VRDQHRHQSADHEREAAGDFLEGDGALDGVAAVVCISMSKGERCFSKSSSRLKRLG
jgi:hypothetical protein